MLHWYAVPAENGTLPYPSRINSLQWRPDQINPSPVGEVSCGVQTYDGFGRIVPPVPGDHICGTREDFEFGGLEDSEEPPLIRGADGIPTCCRDPIRGVMIGGAAIYPDPDPEGDDGLVLGGTAVSSGILSRYGVTIVDPEEYHYLISNAPLNVCTEWRTVESDPDWRLSSTAVRGVVGSWTLTRVADGTVWTRAAWDGVQDGCQIFTLASGSGVPELYVCLEL